MFSSVPPCLSPTAPDPLEAETQPLLRPHSLLTQTEQTLCKKHFASTLRAVKVID